MNTGQWGHWVSWRRNTPHSFSFLPENSEDNQCRCPIVCLTLAKAKTAKWTKTLGPFCRSCCPFSPRWLTRNYPPAARGFPHMHHPRHFLWPSLDVADSFCKMNYLWFAVPPWTQIQHLISLAHTQVLTCLPRPGVMALSWLACDFATWEDLTPGIVIELGRNRACDYPTVWSQDRSLFLKTYLPTSASFIKSVLLIKLSWGNLLL